MKRVRNHIVIQKWKAGEEAENHRGSLSSITWADGSAELWSYELKIGHRTQSGACVLADFTARTGNFKSVTTSTHVNLAKKVDDRPLVMHPLVWRESPVSNSHLAKPF